MVLVQGLFAVAVFCFSALFAHLSRFGVDEVLLRNGFGGGHADRVSAKRCGWFRGLTPLLERLSRRGFSRGRFFCCGFFCGASLTLLRAQLLAAICAPGEGLVSSLFGAGLRARRLKVNASILLPCQFGGNLAVIGLLLLPPFIALPLPVFISPDDLRCIGAIDVRTPWGKFGGAIWAGRAAGLTKGGVDLSWHGTTRGMVDDRTGTTRRRRCPCGQAWCIVVAGVSIDVRHAA
jgi:hypothetical protein